MYGVWFAAVGFAVGCGEAGELEFEASEDVSSSVQSLVHEVLEADGWSEEDRVECSVKFPEELIPGEGFFYKEYAPLPGRPGDIYVVRRCGFVARFNGEVVDDQRDSCFDAHVRIVNESTMLERCYDLTVAHPSDGGGIRQRESRIYARHIGNIDYLDARPPPDEPDPVDTSCWANVDCADSEWCVIQDADTLPSRPWDSETPGECASRLDNSFYFDATIRLFDVEGNEIVGTYDVGFTKSRWAEDPLPGISYGADVAIPDSTLLYDVDLFGARYFVRVVHNEQSVSCDFRVNQNGVLDGGQIIEGDALAGTLLCDQHWPDPEAIMVLDFEVSKGD
ncbi:MAG: hypothetical protein AAGF92_01405 [Myxococcota bacterium]